MIIFKLLIIHESVVMRMPIKNVYKFQNIRKNLSTNQYKRVIPVEYQSSHLISAEPVIVNLLRSTGIDSQSDGIDSWAPQRLQIRTLCWNFRTIYGGLEPSRNRVVVPARQSWNF
jgi:hypothetical protein